MLEEHKFINAFRALAAFWVLASHCMIWGGWYGIPLPSPKIAVDLFMLISGYLMAANAFARQSTEPLTNLRNQSRFWLRRFFRLAPAYYLSLLVAVVTSSYFLVGYQYFQDINPNQWATTKGIYDPMRIDYSLENILLHLSFLFGLFPTWSFSTFLPDWSLSLEMQFYIAFPALILIFKKWDLVKSAALVGVGAFAIGVVINKLIWYYEPSLLFFKLNYFIAGILAFYIIKHGALTKRTIGLIICAFALFSLDIRYKYHWPTLPFLLLCFLYLGWLENLSRLPIFAKKILNSRLISFTSEASYSIYLFHGFFISASGLILSSYGDRLTISPPERVLFMLLFTTFFSYLTAYIVYRAIELPGIHFGKLFIRRFLPLDASSYSNVVVKTVQRDMH